MVAEDEDKTQIAAKPPPKLPSAPPPQTGAPAAPVSDSTQPAAAPPPSLKPASPAPRAPRPESAAPPLPSPPHPDVETDDDEATVFDVRPRSSIRLQRVQPPGHSEIITLDRTSYVVGRLPSCELRLYSPSASREHARLTSVGGAWYVEAVGDHVVLVNGAPILAPTALSHRALLKLGGDELIFLDEKVALTAALPAKAAPAAPSRRRAVVALLAALIAVMLAVGVWWWFTT